MKEIWGSADKGNSSNGKRDWIKEVFVVNEFIIFTNWAILQDVNEWLMRQTSVLHLAQW